MVRFGFNQSRSHNHVGHMTQHTGRHMSVIMFYCFVRDIYDGSPHVDQWCAKSNRDSIQSRL